MTKYMFYGLLIQIFLSSFLRPIDSHGQKESIYKIRIDIQTENLSLDRILQKLESKTDFDFVYFDDVKSELRRKSDLDKNYSKALLSDVLKDLSISYGLKFKRVNNTISIKKSKGDSDLVEEIPLLTIQQVRINGKVTSSEDNTALPGVSILIKGTSNGTTTDINGEFSISAKVGEVLQFSFIGYKTQEIEIGNQSTINIALETDLEQLEEVVVVGYGTQKKKDLTGSVTSVGEESINGLPLASADQMLQGLASGVQINLGSGQPGAEPVIRIRGGTSVTGSNAPLIVVDGIPLVAQSSVGAADVNLAGPLSTINPNDIESMEVLKDAAATAIYGSRGANGVILITTKGGRSGKLQLDIDSYYGVQEVANRLDLLNATQYAELANEAADAAGNALPYTQDQINSFGEGTDWQDEIFRSASMQNHQIRASGGSENIRFSISGNYFKQDGIVINSSTERYGLRTNLESDLTEKLTVGTNLFVSHLIDRPIITNSQGRSNTGESNVIWAALVSNPTLGIFDEDGNYQENLPEPLISNPVALAREITNESFTNRTIGKTYFNYQIIDGLTLGSSIAFDIVNSKSNSYLPQNVVIGDLLRGRANIATLQDRTWTNTNQLDYRKVFADKHSLNATVVSEFQGNEFQRVFTSASGFVVDNLTFNSLGSADTPLQPGSRTEAWTLASFMGRVNYSFDNKYLLTFTARADGASRFAEGNKWGYFPSVSVGWRISEEDFMKGLGNTLSDLKLRGSYGATGNQAIATYASLSRLASTRGGLGQTETERIGFFPANLGNKDLSWETTFQLDIGIDAELFGGRIALTADYFNKKTEDLLFGVQLPWFSSFSNSLQNVGSVRNSGVELNLNTVNVDKEFKWSTNANVTFLNNEVLMLNGTDSLPSGRSAGGFSYGTSQMLIIGQPVGTWFGFVTDGIFQSGDDIANSAQPSAQPGDLRYQDLNNDGTIDLNDRQALGSALPDFFFGLDNTFSYKGFDLRIFLQGSFGNKIANLNRNMFLESLDGRNNNLTTVLDRWTPSNPSNNVPRATANLPGLLFSDRFLEDGSYVRLRNVTFSYNLPSSLNDKLGIRSARVYLSGQNLLTFTDYSGFDPEVSTFGGANTGQGYDFGVYPLARTYSVGINLGL